MNCKKKTFIFLNLFFCQIFFLLILTCGVFAAVGARPLGMGGAYVAVADDPAAAYWNPAGLALKPVTEINFSSALNNREYFSYDDFLTGVWSWPGFSRNEWESPFMEQAIKIGGILLVYETLKSTFKKKDATIPQTEETENLEDVEPAPSPPPPQPPSPMPHPYPWYWFWWDPYYYSWGSTHHHHYQPPVAEKKEADLEIPPTARFYVQALSFSYLRNRNILANGNGHFSDWLYLSLAHRWRHSPWSWGLNFKIMNERIQNAAGVSAASALEADFGILWKVIPDVTLGLNIQDFLNTNFAFDRQNQIEYVTSFRLGVAYRPEPTTVLALDAGNIFKNGSLPRTLHLGVEKELFKNLKIRAGSYDGSPTLGAGLKLFEIQWDLAYFANPGKESYIFGASVFF